MQEREIRFEACLNFRDLGGLTARDGRRVRTGRIYRSMTPEWMSERDIACARDELGVRAVVDLRGPNGTSGPLATAPVRQVHVDFMRGVFEERLPRPETESPGPFFRWWMTISGPEVVEAVEQVATIVTEEGAALFHCRTGKDRTGLVAAMLLGLLGVDDEQIMADYMASTPHFEGMLAFLDEREPRRNHTTTFWPAVEPPSEEGFRAVLEMVRDEYGGARGFLEHYGARAEVLDAFIEHMLE